MKTCSSIGFAFFPLLSFLLLSCSLLSAGCAAAEREETPEDEIRSAVVRYLCSPRHAGTEFNRQILHDITFELYDLDSNFLYFSMPDRLCGNDGGREAIARITQNPDSIEWSQEKNGILLFKNIRGRHTEERGCLFRTPLANLRIDTGQVLSFPFADGIRYDLTPRDLADNLADRTIYGGSRDVYRDDGRNRRYTLFVNHGIFVARPEEPSLKRLVEALIADIPANDPDGREKRVQRLLDFVTTEIAYDYSEAAKNYEVMKRPCETLMSGRSDCSNKATLFASMLEQIGEDYILVYSPEHISVAVPKGKFPETNGHSFDWEEKRWVLCETTATGFLIGTDQLNRTLGFDQIDYVQRPREQAIINPHNGQKLTFR